ncbi:MAG: F0F1 ATP synthase subunit A [Faecalibacterium sp.]
MELNGAKILYTIHTDIPFLGDFKITQTLVVTWLVMAVLTALAWWLGHDLKLENISKRQAAAEFIVERLDRFVHENMGLHFDQYIPLVGAIFALSVFCNLISVLGLWSPTADLNTELAWAVVVFILITYHKLKASGLGGYLKGYLEPIFIMAPINVISELATPISMACRHFGNILSGTVISALIYWALASLSHVVFGWLPGVLGQLQLFQIGIPALTSLYFDWFGGCIQAFIFCTLTTIFIKQAAGED